MITYFTVTGMEDIFSNATCRSELFHKVDLLLLHLADLPCPDIFTVTPGCRTPHIVTLENANSSLMNPIYFFGAPGDIHGEVS